MDNEKKNRKCITGYGNVCKHVWLVEVRVLRRNQMGVLLVRKKLQLYMQVILEINLTMIHAMKVQKKQKKNWV